VEVSAAQTSAAEAEIKIKLSRSAESAAPPKSNF